MTGSKRGGGPRLTSDEWVILLDIFLRHDRSILPPTHPEMITAAELLSPIASEYGRAREGSKLRSPHGLARRLGVLRRLDRGDMREVPSAASAVWQELSDQSALCAIKANSIRQLRAIKHPNHSGRRDSAISPSKGPAPFKGAITVDRLGLSNVLYLMLLHETGISRSSHEQFFVKFGICSDLARRQAELNQYFPPGIGFEWQPLCHWQLDDAKRAYEIEQKILAMLHSAGHSIGGEFARVAPAIAIELANRIVSKW
jgi:hypothetical protein